MVVWDGDDYAGSSPRMRGAPPTCRSTRTRARIIPAYAGSTRLEPLSEGRQRDHPRVCGEHHALAPSSSSSQGSSPRMRGALLLLLDGRLGAGIIPAYAGSTASGRQLHLRPRDHPRVCGEHLQAVGSYLADTGSSPRMRGAPIDDGHISDSMGIIPAYAGSTPR